MANNIIQKIIAKGDELSELRASINKIEEEFENASKPLKERRDQLNEELMLMLKKEGLSSIKSKSGENYILASKKGYQISDEKLAFAWCIERGVVRIDKELLKKTLGGVSELPQGFEVVEKEYIRITSPKKDDK